MGTSFPMLRPGLLSSGTIDILGWVIVVGDSHMCCREFTLHASDASGASESDYKKYLKTACSQF